MWDLPQPGIEPLSLALAGGFLTTAPPGKSPFYSFSFSILDLEAQSEVIYPSLAVIELKREFRSPNSYIMHFSVSQQYFKILL